MTALTKYMWAGAATDHSLQPVICLTATATSVRVGFSLSADLSSPIWSDPVAPDTDFFVRVGDVTGLDADTHYYYAAEIDGVLDTTNVAIGRTFPTEASVVRIAFGGCWDGNDHSNGVTVDHPVGAAVAAQDPNLMIFNGDFGYQNIAVNDPALFRAQFAKMHAIANIRAMVRGTTFNLNWDDHDYGPDNSDGTSPSKTSAASAFRQAVPHYPFPDSDATYHAFDLGASVRIIVTDLRYYRSPDNDTDNADKTMMGAAQKAWFKGELLGAKDAGQFIVWVNSQEWPIDGAYTTSGLNSDKDHWGAFATERAELDNFRADNNIKNMAILCGDGHLIAYTTHNDYSTAGGVSVPVFAAAAMSRAPAFRPARWDQACAPTEGDGHYGLLTITEGYGGAWYADCEFHTVDPDTAADAIEFSSPTIAYDPPTLTRLGQRVTAGNVVTRNSAGQRLGINTLA